MTRRRPSIPRERRPYPRSVGRLNVGLSLVPWFTAGLLWLVIGLSVANGSGSGPVGTDGDTTRRLLDGAIVVLLSGSVVGLAPWAIALLSTSPWPAAYADVPRAEFGRRIALAVAGGLVLAGSVVASYLAALWPAWLPTGGAWGI
ncbi:MAG: hypothetical protein AAGE65_00160 [Planctomycetota bacterium]